MQILKNLIGSRCPEPDLWSGLGFCEHEHFPRIPSQVVPPLCPNTTRIPPICPYAYPYYLLILQNPYRYILSSFKAHASVIWPLRSCILAQVPLPFLPRPSSPCCSNLPGTAINE